MSNKYIGIFDSGVGGLTVVKHIIETLPEENLVFLADNANVPYGDKDKEQIILFSHQNTNILNQYNLKAIVIACNTSDSISRKELEKHYDIPFFGVINPAVVQASKLTKNNKIAVLATKATINSREYEKQLKDINNNFQVYSLACPELVPLIEQGKYNTSDIETVEIMKRYLSQVSDVDTIILGCTHYDLLIDIVKMIRPDLNIVSSSSCVVNNLYEYLNKNNLLNTKKDIDIYLTTKKTKKLDDVSSMIIDNIEFNKVDI